VHDPRHLLDPGTDATARLARRSYRLDLPALAAQAEQRNQVIGRLDALRAEANRLARAGRLPDSADGSREQARVVKEQVQQLEMEHRKAEAELTEFLLAIPNLPAESVPDGRSEQDAVEVRRGGVVPEFDFQPRDHADIGARTGLLDLRRAAKLSGARFAVSRGAGARLERALAAFFLDLHTDEHGYVEHSVPSLVTRKTMTGTGQLPKFEDDLFRTSVAGRELFLIPTAEVPLTNMYAGETLDASSLPLALTAHTPCFRAEAGSYGRDTRGILRLHEFSKVELVRICAPEDSAAELSALLGHAEECLRRLGLAYRVVLLAAGDMAFSARTTYDIEAWLPSQQSYREISSCSDCGSFQARRAGIRLRTGNGRNGHVATINGSGLPIGRTMAAILEQYQEADGGVRIPDALVPYLGFERIAPDGAAAKLATTSTSAGAARGRVAIHQE
jgi:seryl-tRNA synthetase